MKEVPDTKYLGIQIDKKLVSARGNSSLAFIQIILKRGSSKLRDTAYCPYIRPSLAHRCFVWYPL